MVVPEPPRLRLTVPIVEAGFPANIYDCLIWNPYPVLGQELVVILHGSIISYG